MQFSVRFPLITIFMAAIAAPVVVQSAALSNDELSGVVERVVDTHPSVQSARSSLSAAESELSASKWMRFPSLTVEGFSSGNSNGSLSSSVSLEQPLITFGRIKSGIQLSNARVEAARAHVDEVALDVALRATSAYVEYQRLQARARIYAEGVDEHQRLVDSIKRRVEQQ
ncbi:MAG: hypothetical protein RLZZ200_1489, partial [Pseudomonadota bacterium]